VIFAWPTIKVKNQVQPQENHQMTETLTRRNFGGLATAAASALLLPTYVQARSAARDWTKLPTVTYKGKQDDIAFVDADHGFYGNGEGKLYRTSDSGASWEKVWDQPGTFIRALGFIDKDNGFLGNVGTNYYPGVTDAQPLYRTRDAGASWQPISVPGIEKVAGICGIDILPVARLFQGERRISHVIHAAGRVGGPAMVMRSEDSGESWRVLDLSAKAGMILDIKFLTATHGFVAASAPSDKGEGDARILRTTDGGKTWDAVYKSGRPLENCWKMSWPSPKVGYATVQSYDEDPAKAQHVIIKTVTSGKSWTELPLIKDKPAQEFGIGFADEKHGWVGTRSSGYETVDGGKSWAPVAFGKAVNKIRILPKAGGGNIIFAIGVDVYRLEL
jgi:photosystem II stability/assembly factor-like uncharacterized protein